MCNQNQAGIDLTQAASNLGRDKKFLLEKAQPTVNRGLPHESAFDDDLFLELRTQCERNRAQLTQIVGQGLPEGPYNYICLGPCGAELAPLLPPKTQVFTLDQIGAEVDLREFTAPSIQIVAHNEIGSHYIQNGWYQARIPYSSLIYLITYQDGSTEFSIIDRNGSKHGRFQLYYPGLSCANLNAERLSLDQRSVQQRGIFFRGLPCGPFYVYDELGSTLCEGCYELVEASPGVPARTIRLKNLRQTMHQVHEDGVIAYLLHPNGKTIPLKEIPRGYAAKKLSKKLGKKAWRSAPTRLWYVTTFSAVLRTITCATHLVLTPNCLRY